MRSYSILFVIGISTISAFAQAQQGLPAAALRAFGPVALVQDISLTGTVTDAQGQSRPIRAFIKGRDKMRYETGSGAAQVTAIFNGGAGWVINSAGTRRLQDHVAAERPAFIPFLDVLAEADNPRAHIGQAIASRVGARATQRLEVVLPDPTPEKRLKGFPLDEAVTYDIDPATSLIVRSATTIAPESHMGFRVPTSMEFSDYRIVQGVLIPFQYIRRNGFEGHVAQSVVVWQTVLLNQNLPDSLFTPQ